MEEKKDFRQKALDALQEKHRGACVREQKTLGRDFVDLFAWQYGHTILYLIAETREDFKVLSDKIFSRPDHYAGEEKIFVTPIGLISLDELPEDYGLICVREEGDEVELATVARAHWGPCNPFKEKNLFLSALTRNNITNHI